MKFKDSFFFFFLLVGLNLTGQEFITDIKLDAHYFKKEIPEVLVDISKKVGINISFDPNIVSDKKVVSINVDNVTLGDLLDVILEDANLEYKINGRQIIILAKKPKELEFKFDYKELSGYIEDGKTGERLSFAYIYTMDGELAITTNEYGYYNFMIPEGTKEIIVSYLGYEDKVIDLTQLQNGKLNIEVENNKMLEEVVITENKSRTLIDDFDLFVKTDITKIKKSQVFAGQMDVVRYLHTLPGVTTGADGLGGYSVRGANADNNLILLDGIPVYNSSHALGVFSIFNPESIKNATFYRSHIPAQYGGRLASVLDIRTKEGSLTKYGGALNLGLITANGFFEGPIIKDKMSFSLSGRRTLFEPYIKPISEIVKRSQGKEGQNEYLFGDFNGKLQYVLDTKNRFYLSYYFGLDAFSDVASSINIVDDFKSTNRSTYDWSWGNKLISLRWSSQFSSKVFSNVSVYNSQYNFRALNVTSNAIDSIGTETYFRGNGSLYETSISDVGVKWDLDYYLSSHHKIRMGLSAVNHKFSPGLVSRRINDSSITDSQLENVLDDLLISPPRIANELDIYIEDQWTIDQTIVNFGIRASLINIGSKSYKDLQPRLSIKTKLYNGIYAKFSGNITSQYLHLLASSGLGLPTDIWIPSTSIIKPQRAYQLSTGLDFKLAKQLFLTTDVYYKNLRNVLNLKEGAVYSVIEDADWEVGIPVGKGYAYGVELGLKGEIGKHFMNVNYTYGHSRRLFESLNSGKWFDSRFDRRHQLNTSYQVQLNKNISFNFNYKVATGHPITLPTEIFQGEFIYTSKNNQRLPRYDRLDLGIRIDNKFDWGSQSVLIGVYNVYNKKNPYYYYFEIDPEDILNFQAKQVTIFPLLPNASYSLRF